MEIKRVLDTVNAKYDLIGLTREQFSRIYRSYLNEMYRIRHDCEGDDLLKKMQEMNNSDTLIV